MFQPDLFMSPGGSLAKQWEQGLKQPWIAFSGWRQDRILRK